MASVSKRTWVYNGQTKSAYVVRYVDQTGKRRNKTFQKKKEADAYCARVVTELNRGTHVADASTVTLGEAVQAWLDDCERRHKIGDRMAGHTLNCYRRHSRNHVIPELGKIKLTALKSFMIQDFVDLKASSYSGKTLAFFANIIVQSLKFACKREWLIVNPLLTQPIRMPDRPIKEKAIPSKAEIRLILAALTVRQQDVSERSHKARMAMVTLALFAGMRRGEICGLQWENVDFKERVINVRHSLSAFDGLKGPKTRAGIRTIPMAAPVEAILSAIAADTSELTGYVVRGRYGTHIDPGGVYWHWALVMKEAGLIGQDGRPKYTFHSLRHASVSLLIDQGLQPFHIKGIIGHSSVKITTDIYGHLFPEDDRGRAAMESAASQFGNDALPPILRSSKPLLVAQG